MSVAIETESDCGCSIHVYLQWNAICSIRFPELGKMLSLSDTRRNVQVSAIYLWLLLITGYFPRGSAETVKGSF